MKKIVLLCAGGISTSFMVQQMKKATKEKGLDFEISAEPVNSLEEIIEEVDVVLLAPQVSYAVESVNTICEKNKKICGAIPPLLYGRMDGLQVIEYLISIM